MDELERPAAEVENWRAEWEEMEQLIGRRFERAEQRQRVPHFLALIEHAQIPERCNLRWNRANCVARVVQPLEFDKVEQRRRKVLELIVDEPDVRQ